MRNSAVLVLSLSVLLVPVAGCASRGEPQSVPMTGPATSQAAAGRTTSADAGLGDFFTSIYDQITGRTPASNLKLIRSPSADARIRGINGLVARDFGKQPAYTRVYKAVAENDPDPLVRAVAIRALNRSRDRTAVPILIRGLSDANEWVRLESAKALVRLPDPSAIPPLLQTIRRPDETRDVRIAAVDALRHYKNMEVARTLAALLAERDFSIVWQSRRSLRDITRKDFQYDAAKWLEYLANPDRPLS
jgi:HEAT repeat protein